LMRPTSSVPSTPGITMSVTTMSNASRSRTCSASSALETVWTSSLLLATTLRGVLGSTVDRRLPICALWTCKPQADATRDSQHLLGRNSPALIGRPSTRLQPRTQFRVAMRAESAADLATLKSDLSSPAARVSSIKLREPAGSLLRQRAQHGAIYPVTGVPINECGVASTTSTSI
jgi:hypothetical protein